MIAFAGGFGLGSPLLDLILLLAVSFAAGLVGAILGVGGGLFLVPALILLFGLDIHLAIAASLVSIVATTSGAASARLDAGFVNLRLGMFLETATALGGLAGALVSVTLLASHGNLLELALVPVIVASALLMLQGRRPERFAARPPDPLAERLRLSGSYRDPITGSVEDYRVVGTGTGLTFAGIAGLASGLLGVGGGIFKVPAMNSFMNVPLRIAGATSTMMIGVTASAGAIVYLFSGDVALALVAPVVLSVVSGSYVATHLAVGWPTIRLRQLMVGFLALAAALILLRALGVLA